MTQLSAKLAIRDNIINQKRVQINQTLLNMYRHDENIQVLVIQDLLFSIYDCRCFELSGIRMTVKFDRHTHVP